MLFFDLVRTFSRNPSKPIPKRPQSTPKHVPTCPKKYEKVTPTCPKSYPKMTRPSRESNPVPLDSESEHQPTGLFRHQKEVSEGSLCIKNTVRLCPHSRRGFFRGQNSDFSCFHTEHRCFPPRIWLFPYVKAHGVRGNAEDRCARWWWWVGGEYNRVAEPPPGPSPGHQMEEKEYEGKQYRERGGPTRRLPCCAGLADLSSDVDCNACCFGNLLARWRISCGQSFEIS